MDMSHGRAAVVLAGGVLAGVAIGCGGSGPSASPSADSRSRVAPAAPPARVACTRADVEGLVTRFVAAFNRGDERDLDGLFAPKSDFRWYSTDGPGRRLRAAAEDRGTLVAYFRRRHRAGERLRLRSVRFNGGTPAYGNFEYELVRRVEARAPRAYHGKGAAICHAGSQDTVIVWSMARAEGDLTPAAGRPCTPATVHYGPYPGTGTGLGRLPWLRGSPRSSGLVALLWYWPETWQRRGLREARMFTGGRAPAGYNIKVLWAFVGEAARERGGEELVVAGRRLDADGSFTQRFGAISYAGQNGAPSYASGIDVPRPGCWRLRVRTAGLSASVIVRAVAGRSASRAPVSATPARVAGRVRHQALAEG